MAAEDILAGLDPNTKDRLGTHSACAEVWAADASPWACCSCCSSLATAARSCSAAASAAEARPEASWTACLANSASDLLPSVRAASSAALRCTTSCISATSAMHTVMSGTLSTSHTRVMSLKTCAPILMFMRVRSLDLPCWTALHSRLQSLPIRALPRARHCFNDDLNRRFSVMMALHHTSCSRGAAEHSCSPARRLLRPAALSACSEGLPCCQHAPPSAYPAAEACCRHNRLSLYSCSAMLLSLRHM